MEQQHKPSSVICFSDAHDAEMGLNIKRLRKEKGLTQARFAEMMYTDWRNPARYEKGQSLTISNLVMICQALDCTLEYILPAEFRPIVSGMNKALSGMNRSALNAFATSFCREAASREEAS